MYLSRYIKICFLLICSALLCSISLCTAIELAKPKGFGTVDNPSILIVLLGHPGAGKGTFAQCLQDKNVTHISLGDFLRSQYRNQTDIGIRWKEEIRLYGILAIGVVKEVTENLIKKINSEPSSVYILDGHVRTVEQAMHLDHLLLKYQNIYPLFIYIDTEKNIAFRRMLQRRSCEQCHFIYNMESFPPKIEDVCDKCGGRLTQRDTDNEVHALNRINTYEPYLADTVQYYRNKHVLIEFNGNSPIEKCIAEYRNFFLENIDGCSTRELSAD